MLHFYVSPWLVYLFMRLPWPGGLSGLCCSFCHSFLTSCGVDKLLGLRSLYFAFFLGSVLLGHGHFLLQFSPCLLCGLANTFATQPHCLFHVAFWFVLARPLLGLLRTFPFYSVHVAQYYCWACSHTILGFLYLFYSFGYPWSASFLQASLTHSNPSFSWGFAKSFGLFQPIYHILYFRGLLAFLPTLFTNSFLWAHLAYFCLLSISHNSHGFTTFLFGLLWACLLFLGPFYYLTGPWTIIPAIWV